MQDLLLAQAVATAAVTRLRAVRKAQARDKVKRNVVGHCDVPTGKAGRPSKSLTLDQGVAVLAAAEASTLHAYVVLSLPIGARTEELRALRWRDVDLIGQPDANPAVPASLSVVRSVRAGGRRHKDQEVTSPSGDARPLCRGATAAPGDSPREAVAHRTGVRVAGRN